MKQNAKTNNKASQIGGPFFIDNKKGNTMTSENPLLALREKISALDEKIISITGRATRTG